MKFNQFAFLTDENIDFEVVEWLRQKGLDVLDIKEQNLFGLEDKEILGLAFQEQRVILSQDSDFGTLIFRDQAPTIGVIFLRPGHFEPLLHIPLKHYFI